MPMPLSIKITLPMFGGGIGILGRINQSLTRPGTSSKTSYPSIDSSLSNSSDDVDCDKEASAEYKLEDGYFVHFMSVPSSRGLVIAPAPQRPSPPAVVLTSENIGDFLGSNR
mmetsp:Transcript_52876/g.63656  ORF Transcript_52876/g.63656 Transcript_52876/m.63656 type:complete len:112 (-) Transcript_52876:58-393(-)